MKKRVLSMLLCSAMVATMFAGCGDNSAAPSSDAGSESGNASASADAGDAEEEDNTDPSKTIYVYAFTDEVPNMLKKYVSEHPDFGYEIKETIVATTDGAYQPALDQALKNGGDKAPDIYCAEAAFVLKYTQGDASGFAAAYKDLGIDVDTKIADAEIAQYSVDIGTNPNGDVVGLGYQATGGAFIYRRSIAKDTFGTDDPAKIAEIIGAGTNSWDKFFEAADQLAAKGYATVSGDGDMWHAIENSSDQGWVVDGKLHLDTKREAFLDVSKTLTDKGYSNVTQDWQDAWFADMQDAGAKKVFGFFGPAWLINYTIGQNCGDTAGDWAVCAPPIGFFWGGTWLLANKDTAKKEAVAELLEWVTLDTSEDGLQYKWANGTLNGEGGTKDSVASGVVMSKSDGALDFLGGQDMFEAFVPANKYANGKNLTQYDETINSAWRDQVRSYAAGEKDRDAAIADFKSTVSEKLGIDAE